MNHNTFFGRTSCYLIAIHFVSMLKGKGLPQRNRDGVADDSYGKRVPNDLSEDVKVRNTGRA